MSVKISLTGDFCPIGRIDTAIREGGVADLFESVEDLFSDSHLVIADLECPLTESSAAITKTGPHLKGHPKAAGVLRQLGCDLVATANNHFMDFGFKGCEDTYAALEENGIQWVGSGASVTAASTPAIKECGGLKIAVLNMTENEWSTTHDASPGCCPIDFPIALNAINTARESADFVLVILHGGHEHYELPSPRMQRQFRFMIDAGADAVVGHHTHVISGYEIYRNKPIFYSLGNFCIDSPEQRNSAWNTGVVLQLEISENPKVGFQLVPVSQNDDKPGVRVLEDEKALEVRDTVERLREVIEDPGQLEARFEAYCQSRTPVVLSQIQPYSHRVALALHRRGLLPDIVRRRKRKFLTALCQCESHRELLLHALRSSL